MQQAVMSRFSFSNKKNDEDSEILVYLFVFGVLIFAGGSSSKERHSPVRSATGGGGPSDSLKI